MQRQMLQYVWMQNGLAQYYPQVSNYQSTQTPETVVKQEEDHLERLDGSYSSQI